MNPKSIILQAVARVLVFFINIYGIYIMLQGHNNPGGGFIAGLIGAISLVMLNIALGLDELKKIIRIDPVFIAVLGLIFAYATSLAPTFFGLNFLKHEFYHGSLPFLGEVHIGTPLVFDFGVYLVVIGITSKILITFSYLVWEKKQYFLEQTILYSSADETPASQKDHSETNTDQKGDQC